MPKGQLDRVINHLRCLVAPGARAAPADRLLLDEFARSGQEAAFAALVRRHGGLVLGVCRRVLLDEHDAEDAFQATFLILAKKAGSIRKRESLGSWLYGVAYRTALKARGRAARRRAREQAYLPVSPADPIADLVWRELRPVLDEELNRLPEKYRAPVVLCYLENKTNTEAARQLGLTKGTVSGRLARARDLLRARLTRRGLALSGGLVAAALSHNATAAVPARLGAATVQAAALAGSLSAPVAALTEGVLQAMLFTKVKLTAAALLAVTVLGAGTFLLGQQLLAEKPAPKTSIARPPNAAKTDLARMQGTWVFVSFEYDGSKMPKATRSARLIILKDKMISQLDQDNKVTSTFTLNTQTTPRSIDFVKPAQRFGKLRLKEQLSRGIYEFDGTRLQLCFTTGADGKRPQAFVSKPGSGVVLMILERAAEDDLAALKKQNEQLKREVNQLRAELAALRQLARAQRDRAEQAHVEAQRQRAVAELERARAEAARAEEEARRAADGARRAVLGAREASARARSANNMKQIALAFHNYHDTNGRFPAAAIYSKAGKPLLSWRVALLPYLEEGQLYQQFKLDEPWDSAHNKKLLAKMPKIYASPGAKPKDASSTFYQVFTGKGTIFDDKVGRRLTDITDGTSNTILTVEAGKAVPWTRPEDVPYAADKPVPKLGGVFKDGFTIGLADGSVRFIRKPVNEKALRLAITRADGEPVELDKLEKKEDK